MDLGGGAALFPSQQATAYTVSGKVRGTNSEHLSASTRTGSQTVSAERFFFHLCFFGLTEEYRSFKERQMEQELSEEEGLSPEQLIFRGLFRPHLFKALLFKAKASTKLGTADAKPGGSLTEQDPADLLFAEPATETDTIPAPPLFLDMIQRQWASLGSHPNTSSYECRYYNATPNLNDLLQVPEVDEPVMALASPSAALAEAEEVLKPEDRKL